jgi:hypothetical protein
MLFIQACLIFSSILNLLNQRSYHALLKPVDCKFFQKINLKKTHLPHLLTKLEADIQ